MPAKSCKTCAHGRWQLTAIGSVKRNEPGRCAAPLPMAPEYPECVRIDRPRRVAVWPDDGAKCPAFVAGGKPKPWNEPDPPPAAPTAPYLAYDGARPSANFVYLVWAESPQRAAELYVARTVEASGARPAVVYVCEYESTRTPGLKLAANTNGDIRFDVQYRKGVPVVEHSEKSFA